MAKWLLPSRANALAAAMAGLAGGAAFALVLKADLRLTGNRVDDFAVLGRPVVRKPEAAHAVGVAIHAVNSVALAQVYALLEPHIPGSPWQKGVIFANVENLLLYPITVLEDLHPSIRDGQVDSYWTWPSFWQSVPRHIAYGAVLGVVYDRVARREIERVV